jgi:serine/threonine protein kinase
MSRYYRSPEVITVQNNYSQSADVWSLGCILLEFLTTLSRQPRYLFRGKLCNPISPGKDGALQNDDQLVKILERLDNFDQEQQFSFAQDPESREYMKEAMGLI